MLEHSDDSSAWLVSSSVLPVINEVFIDGFHALYNIHISNTCTQALFDTDTSINAISHKFFSSIQQQFKPLPTNKKVVSADGDSFGPIGEMHIKFKVGKIEFDNIFIILDSLQQDVILGLLWQHNYKIGCSWSREGKHFLNIKNKFLALSIGSQVQKQIAVTKGQCTIPGRSITWICIRTPRNIKANMLLEITSGRQLPKGLIPLDILHNVHHKQLQEMLIPILNISTYVVKLPKNTLLGSITEVDESSTVYSICSLHQHNGQACDENEYSKPLLPAFPDCSSFTTHAHDNSKSPIQLQHADVPTKMQQQLHSMLTSKFSNIISKSPADFRHTNLAEMDLPTIGPPVSSKPYTIPLKYQSFVDEEIQLLEDAGCISKSLGDWASSICIIKKNPNPSQLHKIQLYMCISYRKENQCLVTAHNSNSGKVVSTFPLSKIQELLSHLNKCKYFSSLNLHSGYYHISLTEEAKKKTAFVTADGMYQWNIVPFGLATAVSTFQYLMSKVLTGLRDFAFTYLDDVLVFSETYDNHICYLNEVFACFKKAGLKIKLSNGQFFKTQLHYLGHKISADGLEPLPENSRPSGTWHQPKT